MKVCYFVSVVEQVRWGDNVQYNADLYATISEDIRVYLDVDGLDLDLFLRARWDEDLREAALNTWTKLRSGTISGALNLP